jgi:hypothetical protein
MSLQHRNETTPLRDAQRNYRRAWNQFTTEVESLQSALNQGLSNETVNTVRERVDNAAAEYRIARDVLAQVLLAQDAVTIGTQKTVCATAA